MSVKDYAKNEIKNKLMKALKPLLIKAAAIALAVVAILLLIVAITSLIAGAIGGAENETETQNFTTATGDSWEQFIRWMHSLEGNEGEEGDYYIIGPVYSQALGYSTRTVGYGIDLDTSGAEAKLLAKGYTKAQLQMGGKVKKEDIDAIEEEEIKALYAAVESAFAGTDIKEYQKYAFTLLAYNNGASCLTRFYGGKGVKKAYQDMHKIDDSKYLYHKEKVEFTSDFAQTYLAWNSGGQLTERRKVEWCAYETGWYGWGVEHGNGNGLKEYWCGGESANVQAFLKKIQDEGIKCSNHNVSLAPGTTYNHHVNGSSQCKGYATCVFYDCFGVYAGAYPESQNYILNDTDGMTLVGTASTQDEIKNLFSKARPGDFIQMRRSHGGPHSAIVYSVNADGTIWMENNTDGNCGTFVNTYSWDNLAAKNAYISIYTATNYKLK